MLSPNQKSVVSMHYKTEDSINQTYPIQDPVYFSDSKTNTFSSKKGKNRIKKKHKHKPVHLYNWSQPIRHINDSILTVIKRKDEQRSK